MNPARSGAFFPDTDADYTRENMKYTEGSYGQQPLILESEMERNDGDLLPGRSPTLQLVRGLHGLLRKKRSLPQRFVTPEKTNEKAMIENRLE